jgi:hypothetical protein
LEVIDGASTNRYCCGEDLPEQMDRSENAVILRLRIDERAKKTRGFTLDWEESELNKSLRLSIPLIHTFSLIIRIMSNAIVEQIQNYNSTFNLESLSNI